MIILQGPSQPLLTCMKRNLMELSSQSVLCFREERFQDHHRQRVQQEVRRRFAMVLQPEVLHQQVIEVLRRDEVATVVAEVVEMTSTVVLIHDIPDRHRRHVVVVDHTPTLDHRRERRRDEEVRLHEARLVVAEDHQATVATAAEVEVVHGVDQSVEIDMEDGGEKGVSY